MFEKSNNQFGWTGLKGVEFMSQYDQALPARPRKPVPLLCHQGRYVKCGLTAGPRGVAMLRLKVA